MNRFLQIGLLISFLVTALTSFAQRTCKAHEASEELKKHDTAYARIVNSSKQLLTNNNFRLNGSGPYTIPVVVHVIYNTPEQNISEAQIQSQIDVLNQDYSLTNPNFSTTPSYFQSFAGNAGIKFVLAKRTPDGLPTNGITRTATNVVDFGSSDDMKSTAKGGIEPWNPSKYMNIWVCNMSGALGFAYFPGASPSIDGVVIAYNCFGTIGTAVAPYHLGRTATHEVGHYLNLKHIWGDKNDCTGDDLVGDTPLHHDANYDCRTFPYKVCTNTPSTGEMYVNYMDYSPDVCMTMFSQGQVSRMINALTTSRASLLTSDGATGFDKTIDAALLQLTNPQKNTACGPFQAQIKFYNLGTDTLKSANITFYNNNNLVQTINWTGKISPLGFESITFNQYSLPQSSNNLVFTVSNPNNAVDGNLSNDTLKFSINKIDNVNLPLFESFEDANFPPTGWSISNPDNNISWESTSDASTDGTKSLVFKNFDATNLNGQHDVLISPSFKVYSNSSLSLQFAYSVYSSPFVAGDTLTISISTDCGVTKEVIYKNGGSNFATTNTKFQTTYFIPNGNNEWKKLKLPLASYANKDAILYFDLRTEYENNLYIDSIYVNKDGVLGLEKNSNPKLSVYPNPNDGNFTVQLNGGFDKLEINSLYGNNIITLGASEESVNQININNSAKGIYILTITKDNQVLNYKIDIK